jgi:16S rRNA (uracil1498-N3)-methyltransferase
MHPIAMPSPRYYVSDDLRSGATGQLSADQARQSRSVLRLRPGAALTLFNGTGVEAAATLTALDARDATYEVRSVLRPEREPPVALTIGLAWLRGEHFDLAVQKLTELGVVNITPLAAERCVVSYEAAADWEKRRARLERIAREAAEQSERVTLPNIEPPSAVEAFLERRSPIALVERTSAAPLASLTFAPELALAIGPEGGWTERETRAIERGAAGVASLGRLIYRAETAAIVAAGVVIQAAWAGRHAQQGADSNSWA